MWVKICANTNLNDALYAIDAGADAVGFVFASSKRQVTADQVRAITERLPSDVERVGVFAGVAPEWIAGNVQEAGLTAVQLHDDAGADGVARLRDLLGPSVSLIHVVQWDVRQGVGALENVRRQLETLAAAGLDERVLIDAKVGAVSGGLGVRFDWDEAAAVLTEYPGLRVIIAGGLTPGNVSEAVAKLAPYGVDVASGVELKPGKKDFEKVRTFIEKARRV